MASNQRRGSTHRTFKSTAKCPRRAVNAEEPFVARAGCEVDAQGPYVDRKDAGGLDDVGVDQGTAFVGRIGYLADRLDTAVDVAEQGDRNQRCPLVHGIHHGLRIHVPVVPTNDAYVQTRLSEPEQVVQRTGEMEVVGHHVATGLQLWKAIEDDLLSRLGALDQGDFRLLGTDERAEAGPDIAHRLAESITTPIPVPVAAELLIVLDGGGAEGAHGRSLGGIDVDLTLEPGKERSEVRPGFGARFGGCSAGRRCAKDTHGSCPGGDEVSSVHRSLPGRSSELPRLMRLYSVSVAARSYATRRRRVAESG